MTKLRTKLFLISNCNNQFFIIIILLFIYKLYLGIGDWGLGIGDWGLGIGPNPQSPIPNPQSPTHLLLLIIYLIIIL